jgi:Tol biopolymer transport system component
LYVLSMDGGEAHPVTKISTGVDIVKWSPDGKTLAFTSSVYPDCVSRASGSPNNDDECNKKRNDEKEKNKVKAHVAENLLYRHWTHWNEGARAHLFVIAPDGSGEAKDLTAGADYDVPPDQRGEESDINFSPDSKEICFTAVTDKVEATSTNGDLFIVPVSGGEPKRITTQPGFDGNPVYSPDGKYLAYHAQLTAGYEADRWRVMLYDRASRKSENLSEGYDRSATNLAWSPDSKTIYFLAENETQQPVYAMAARPGAAPKKLVEGFNSAFQLSEDGKTLLLARTSLTMPAELFVAASDGTGLQQVTHMNDALLAKLELNAPAFWFEGAEGIRAGDVDPSSTTRREQEISAAGTAAGGPRCGQTRGVIAERAAIFRGGLRYADDQPAGSTGYGQKFTDEITNDWGGKAYGDVMKGVDAAR